MIVASHRYGDWIDDLVNPVVSRIEAKLQPKAESAIDKIKWWAIAGGVILGVTSAYVTYRIMRRSR